MTTIACNRREIAADSRVSWDGVSGHVFSAMKLFPIGKAIYGITGENCTGSIIALDWFRAEKPKDFRPVPPEFDHDWNWKIIELSVEGIGVYNEHLERDIALEPFAAVGSGGEVAYYCMKERRMSPAQAVHEACKVDHHSEAPIFTAKLCDLVVRPWSPPKKRKR